MKTVAKSIALASAAGLLALPAASYAGNRPALPVGLQLAPAAALAVEPSLTEKRKTKKVSKESNLLGMSVIPALSSLLTSTFLQANNNFGSRGAN